MSGDSALRFPRSIKRPRDGGTPGGMAIESEAPMTHTAYSCRILLILAYATLLLFGRAPLASADAEEPTAFGPDAEFAYIIGMAYWGYGRPEACESITKMESARESFATRTEPGRTTSCLIMIKQGLDFGTTCVFITHELGDLLGMPRSENPYSIMYVGSSTWQPFVPGCTAEVNRRATDLELTQQRERCAGLPLRARLSKPRRRCWQKARSLRYLLTAYETELLMALREQPRRG